MVKTNDGEWVCPDCHVEQTEDEFMDEYGVEVTDLKTGKTIELSWRELLEWSKDTK